MGVGCALSLGIRYFPQYSIFNNMWRIRTNQELQEMQKHLDIIANTKKKKKRKGLKHRNNGSWLNRHFIVNRSEGAERKTKADVVTRC